MSGDYEWMTGDTVPRQPQDAGATAGTSSSHFLESAGYSAFDI